MVPSGNTVLRTESERLLSTGAIISLSEPHALTCGDVRAHARPVTAFTREPSSLRCGYSNLPRNKKLIAGTAPSHSAPPPSPLTLRLCDHQSQPRRREDRCRRQQQDLPVAQRNWRRVITHVCPNVLIILPLKNYINTYFFFR